MRNIIVILALSTVCAVLPAAKPAASGVLRPYKSPQFAAIEPYLKAARNLCKTSCAPKACDQGTSCKQSCSVKKCEAECYGQFSDGLPDMFTTRLGIAASFELNNELPGETPVQKCVDICTASSLRAPLPAIGDEKTWRALWLGACKRQCDPTMLQDRSIKTVRVNGHITMSEGPHHD